MKIIGGMEDDHRRPRRGEETRRIAWDRVFALIVLPILCWWLIYLGYQLLSLALC